MTHSTGGVRRLMSVAIGLVILLTATIAAPAVVLADDPPPPMTPIDPQIVTQPKDQDWDDYHPIPTGPNYADNSIQPTVEEWDVGLILNDFPDTPFTITQPAGSDVFGNPGPLGANIPRANVPAFYVDWLGTPSAANNYQTMNRYWMEDSFGRYGVNMVGYGPYQLFGDQGEYFIDDIAGSNNSTCNVQTRSINSAQASVTSIEVASSASFSVGKILMNVAADIGGGGTLSATRTVTAIPDATHLETGNATTFSNNVLAGAMTFRVGNSTGILAGHSLNIGWDDRLETKTVSTAGDGSGSANLSTASAAGATNIKIASVTGFIAGETIIIDAGTANQELATILTVGTSGAAGTGITVTAPLTFAHASGINASGSWITLTAGLTHGHATNTIVRDMNSTPFTVAANTYLHTCNRNFRTDAAVAWADHVPQSERDALDNFFVVSAGQDESGTWQEFGEMQFTGGPSPAVDTVPDALGPPNPEIPTNWAATRYIPWTSWRSAATVWPSASGTSSTEGEGSGMAVYAHELSHNLGLPDNYNNPYIAPFQRAATGYWSMMSRGSFNGPGGTHQRWRIPSTMGTALGAQHVLRDKIFFGFAPASSYVDLDRNDLATSGLAVFDIQAREAEPTGANQLGVRINLDGGDANPPCTVMPTPRVLAAAASIGDTNIKVDSITNFTVNSDVVVGDRGNDELARVAAVGTAGAGGTGVTLAAPLTKAHPLNEIVSNRLSCSGPGGFNNYVVEVNQQIGSDSFQASTGVLIEKNKTSSSSCGPNSFNCFAWVVDAHPTDINIQDFVRPDSSIQWVTTGDPRQLTDATFHAGTNSGSFYEWTDSRNNLRFFILNRSEVSGVVHYQVAVQNLTGNGPHTRGVTVDNPTPTFLAENNGHCNFNLNNTGTFSSFTNGHPETSDITSAVSNDVYRLSTSVTSGTGWMAQLPNELAYAPFGGSTNVPVYITRTEAADDYATITLTATSVSDPTKTSTATCSFDQVAPVTTADLQPPATNTYYDDPTTVTLTASDDTGSGIASTEYDLDGAGFVAYTAPFQVTGDGPHTLAYRSTDNAGNVEATNMLEFTIDATGPEITITEPADGGQYPLDSVQLAEYECTDAVSGVVDGTCVGTVANGAEFDTSSVGFHEFTVTAEDVAGNESSTTIQYNVYWDQWSGFLPPIQEGVNTRKAGSNVPVNFSLGGDYGLAIFMAGTPTSQQVNCTTLAPIGAAQSTSSPGGSGITFSDGAYHYNWKTNASWKNTCREFTVSLIDNTTHTALFSFVK